MFSQVAEIGRLGATLKDLRQQHIDKEQQAVHRVEGGYSEVVDILRSLGESQVHCGDALDVLTGYVEETCRLGSQPDPVTERATNSTLDADSVMKEPLWDAKLWNRLLIQPPSVDGSDDFAKGMDILTKSMGAKAGPEKLALDRLQSSSQSLSGLEKFLVVKEALKGTFVLSRHSREQPSLAQYYCKGQEGEPALAGFYGKNEGSSGAKLTGSGASWHCVVDGAEVSEEYDLQQLCDLYLSGAVTDSTKCWTQDMSEWAAIGTLGAFGSVREQRTGVTAISLAIDRFMQQLESSVQSHLRECGGMKAVDESIARIMEQCVQGPMRACLALKQEQEKAAEASALLATKQQTCEQELAALTTMLESGTSQVDLGNVDTVYDAVTLTDLGEASAMLAAKEAELHEIMKERLALNASLRDVSEDSLRVGDSPETRLKSLHALAIDDVASFATKQAGCNR